MVSEQSVSSPHSAAPAKPLVPYEAGTEGLRGFAALLVLYTHLLGPGDVDPAYHRWSWFHDFEVSQGAVLLFFILSGYVIGLTNARPFSADNWRSYLWRRVVRLVPIYWAAIALTALVRPDFSWRTLLGNALFLQNDAPYGNWSMPVLPHNSNLWTLNYEALYYLLFAVCWIRPSSWKIWSAIALAVAVAGWKLPLNWAVLTTCFAMGWIFWLAGYGLSRLKSGALVALPWISVFFFWAVTWREKPLWVMMNRLNLLPAEGKCWITYGYLDILPASIVLLLAASGRRPRGTRLLCWLSAAIPLGYLAWVALRGRLDWSHPGSLPVYCALGCIFWRWRPDGVRAWGRLAWVGSISYGIYVLQRPAQWLVLDSSWLPSGHGVAYVLRLGLAVALTFLLAWVAERKFQPWIRRKLTKRHPAPHPAAVPTA